MSQMIMFIDEITHLRLKEPTHREVSHKGALSIEESKPHNWLIRSAKPDLNAVETHPNYF